jgi:hypothetical protein
MTRHHIITGIIHGDTILSTKYQRPNDDVGAVPRKTFVELEDSYAAALPLPLLSRYTSCHLPRLERAVRVADGTLLWRGYGTAKVTCNSILKALTHRAMQPQIELHIEVREYASSDAADTSKLCLF